MGARLPVRSADAGAGRRRGGDGLTGAIDELVLLRAATGLADDVSVLWWLLAEAALTVGQTGAVANLAAIIDRPEDDHSVPTVFRGHQQRAKAHLALAAGDHAEARAALEAALTAYDDCHWRVAHARTAAELARLLADSGDPEAHDRAAELVEQARTVFEEIGATAWLAELSTSERERTP